MMTMEHNTSRTLYASLPLDPNVFSTRLLTILPGAGDQQLRCRLRTTQINANISYEALSYTWGNSCLCRNITVNKQNLSITASLEEALRALRRCSKRRTIWVDALCIDQGNLAEKGVCVRGMGYIYRLATQVIIWLGPGGPYTDVALRCILHNELANKPPPLPHYNYHFVCWDEEERELIKQWKRYRELEGAAWAGLHDLAHRQWWTRVWVVQEVCMAAGDPLLICGQSFAPWSSFVRIVRSNGTPSAAFLHILEMDGLRKRARKPPRLRNLFSTGDVGMSLSLLEDDLHWLRYTATFEASDPRDKIFALLSLMRGPLRGQIEVDYTESMADVTNKLMLNQINCHGSLSLLALCQTGDVHHPSWLPDFVTSGLPPLPSSLPSEDASKSDPYSSHFASRKDAMSALGGVAQTTFCRMDPGNDSVIKASGSFTGTVQNILTGRRIDKLFFKRDMIRSVGQRTEDFGLFSRKPLRDLNNDFHTTMQSEPLDRCNSLLSQANSSVAPLRPSDITLSNFDEQLPALDICQREIASGQLQRECEPLVRDYRRFFEHSLSWAELHCHWFHLFSKLSSSDNIEDLQQNDADKFFAWEVTDEKVQAGNNKRASILHAMKGRYQFTTDTGLLGVGPLEMREGDKIVLFDASPFAFAIREHGRRHELIGQVLVCPPLLPEEYPMKNWLQNRPTDYPKCWKEPTRQTFVLE